MNHSAITALSPLDGRYANKLTALRALMSEQGYMHRRIAGAKGCHQRAQVGAGGHQRH